MLIIWQLVPWWFLNVETNRLLNRGAVYIWETQVCKNWIKSSVQRWLILSSIMFPQLRLLPSIWPQMTADVGMCFIFRILVSPSPSSDYYSVDGLFGTRTKVCIINARPSSIFEKWPRPFLVHLTKQMYFSPDINGCKEQRKLYIFT